MATKQHVLSVVGVKSTHQFEKYVGLPALIGSSKVEAFFWFTRENMGAYKWLEGEIPLPSREGGALEGCHPIYTYLHDERFSVAKIRLQEY
jgi:hypothetical protein